jgi:protein involved in polysaccharide export with SLBB domain
VRSDVKERIVIAVLAVCAAAVLAAGAACSSGMKPPEQGPGGEQGGEFNPFEQGPGDEDYLVRPGDSVRVHFLYNPELDVASTTVRSDGKISLPVVGDMLVAGKTASELTQEVRTAYDTYISGSGHGRVLRAGDELQLRFTYNPQLNQRAYVRPDGKLSLLLLGELQADGVEFSRFEQIVSEGYAEFIKEPEISIYLLSTPTKKIYTDAGDITVMVASSRAKQVFVGGEVGEPKLIEFRDRLTPLQAVLQAGGILESGNLGGVILVTRAEGGGAVAAKINLAAYMKSGIERSDISLRDGDVVIVPRTGIAKVNLVVRQYIRDSLPLQTGFGFSYLLNERWRWQ